MKMKKKSELINAVSELKEVDYTKAPELQDMYQRLQNGRVQLESVFDKNMKAVMQISSLDLAMQYQTEKILDISKKVEMASERIFGTSGSSDFGGHADNQQTELTNTIIDVASETDGVYRKIEESQNELTAIKELSSQTIEISKKLQQDMDGLFQSIDNIVQIISGIDSILNQ